MYIETSVPFEHLIIMIQSLLKIDYERCDELDESLNPVVRVSFNTT